MRGLPLVLLVLCGVGRAQWFRRDGAMHPSAAYYPSWNPAASERAPRIWRGGMLRSYDSPLLRPSPYYSVEEGYAGLNRWPSSAAPLSSPLFSFLELGASTHADARARARAGSLQRLRVLRNSRRRRSRGSDLTDPTDTRPENKGPGETGMTSGGPLSPMIGSRPPGAHMHGNMVLHPMMNFDPTTLYTPEQVGQFYGLSGSTDLPNGPNNYGELRALVSGENSHPKQVGRRRRRRRRRETEEERLKRGTKERHRRDTKRREGDSHPVSVIGCVVYALLPV